jgi:hypothetical protein
MIDIVFVFIGFVWLRAIRVVVLVGQAHCWPHDGAARQAERPPYKILWWCLLENHWPEMGMRVTSSVG